MSMIVNNNNKEEEKNMIESDQSKALNLNNNLENENIANNLTKRNITEQKQINLVFDHKIYQFYINNSLKNINDLHFKNNTIDTTKYNLFTFLPKGLLYQFMRLANVYFLIILIIQCIPAISPLSPITAILPLVFVLCVSLIREGIEDCSRASMDKQQNMEEIEVYRNNQWTTATSGSLQIGEIVCVKKDQAFPADLALIDSNLSEGICYIETGTLDGEKTLKLKNSPNFTKGKFNSNIDCYNNNKDVNNNINNKDLTNHNSDNNNNKNKNDDNNNNEDTTNNNKEKITKFNIFGYIQCDLPNAELYKLNGKINMTLNNENTEFPLDSKQLLLKGAKLKNTNWIIGIVIYTGHNCKLLKNSKNPVNKVSSLEKLMSQLLIFILISQTILCIISVFLHWSYYNENLQCSNSSKQTECLEYIGYRSKNYSNIKYLSKINVPLDRFLTFFTYFLLLNTMIPISLMVTLEIVKVFQGLFISFDVNGYSRIRDKYIHSNSISLNEELGMVDYIFSDKTGTLTCNKMSLKFCVIGDICYEYIKDDFENNKDLREKENITPFSHNDMGEIITNNSSNKFSGFNSSTYNNYVIKSLDNPSNSIELNCTEKILAEYWQALALCHDCTIQLGEYVSMSPDSVELVKSAKSQGIEFASCSSNAQFLLKMGSQEKYFDKLLNIEFSSDRKRESVIVKDGNLIKLYIKGADSIIKERLNESSTPPGVLDRAQYYVDLFSAHGYRTLFVGMRILSQKEFDNFYKEYENGLMDTEKKDEKVAAAFAMVENNITLLGATIVEDKLQDKVPETIKDLREAEIKIWMLTGDKLNTAYNIGLSCNLISKEMKVFFVEGVAVKLNDKLRIINNEEREQKIINFAKEYEKFKGEFDSMTKPKFGLLVDEKALLTITDNYEMERMFLNIAKDAAAVICCRVSPLQKSQVVKMMKNYKKDKITLAIGDGGNDVSMIMEAHIGIGIYGEEGLRAVQSSDYSIGEFKILRQLLLFHGYNSLLRNSDLVLYFFYKNFVFTIIHFFFGFYNNFSGQTIIDDWFITCYNLFFTSLPLGLRAVLDYNFREEDGKLVRILQPYLYKESRNKPIFTRLAFALSIFKGICHALINFFFVIYCVNKPIDDDGNYADLWYISVNLYTNIIIIVTIDLIVFTKYHSWLNFLFIGVTTFLLYIIFLFMVHNMTMFNSVGTMYTAFTSARMYINIVVVCGFCGAIDCAISFGNFLFNHNLLYSLKAIENKNVEEIPKNIQNIIDGKICEKEEKGEVYNDKIDDDNYNNIQADNQRQNGSDNEMVMVLNNNNSKKLNESERNIKE